MNNHLWIQIIEQKNPHHIELEIQILTWDMFFLAKLLESILNFDNCTSNISPDGLHGKYLISHTILNIVC